MFHRFGKKRSPGVLWDFLLPVAFFVAILIIFSLGLENVSETVQEEQLKSTEQAIRRATVQCYAIEGHYPQSFSYLEEHYGLRVDSQRYLVHYQSVGSNLMPQIQVFSLEKNRD